MMNVLILLATLNLLGGLAFSPATEPGAAEVGPFSDWRIEPVAFHGGSAAPPLDVGADGRPHVMYCPPGESWYAVRTDAGWEREFLTATPFGGVCGELAIGPADSVHVTTPVAAGLGLPLYGVRRGAPWTFEPTDIGSVQAVDSLDRPHSAYLVRTSPDRVVLVHVWRDGVWHTEEVEAFVAARTINARWSSPVLDADDDLHVLYYDDVRGDVRYAFRDDTGWHVEVVETIGALNIAGKEGSLSIGLDGTLHAAYTVRTSSNTAEVRYAAKSGVDWSFVPISRAASPLGGGGFAPSLALSPVGPTVAYIHVELFQSSPYVASQDLVVATRVGGAWSDEIVVDGLNDQVTGNAIFPQFPAVVTDSCGNPHLAFFFNRNVNGDTSQTGVYYATKGAPCNLRTVSVDLDPDTLNLKSKGKWVTAYVTAEGAEVEAIDAASLALNGVPGSRWSVEGDTLVAKFDRPAFAATVQTGEAVVVTLTGRWKDGGTFTATDTIRVINPGR